MLGGSVTIRRRRETATAILPDDLHPVVRRVLARRELAEAGDLDLALERLPDPSDLHGCEAAAARPPRARARGAWVRV
ncbi:MAG: hypothetical protein R3298_07190 [Gammaproteobacteria bacterium]|nr:hypothetical protein [Gammaproteobacteria bacterium]